jgi:hypothetical protein
VRLYLSRGRHWTGTQADAKAAQGGTNTYETIEVPDAKPERMRWLNEQWAKLLGDKAAPVIVDGAGQVKTLVIPERAPEPEPEPEEDKSYVGSPRNKREIDWQSAPEPGSCKRCVGMSRAARMIEEIMAVTNIEHAIFHAEAPMLAKLEEAIRERRLELAAQEPPAARVRVRTRTPEVTA